MSAQVKPQLAVADTGPDVIVRGACRCALVRAWLTSDGWMLCPVWTRGFRPEAITGTRQHDSIVLDRTVEAWDSPEPLSVWCRHGVSAPDVAQAVRRWRPRMRVAA